MSDTTTVAAEQSEAHAVARPVSPFRRALSWVLVVGVVALGSLGFAASDLATTPERGGDAARFVPADGAVVLVTSADGTRTVNESARGTGPGMLLELPPIASAHYFGDDVTDELRTAQLWRETVTALDTDDPQTTSVYRLDEAGVSALTFTGGATSFSYSPGLVVLPADAAPGATWEGAGDAMPQGLMRYTTTGRIEAADDGCLLAVTEVRYLDPDTDAELLAIADESTWCPGRGVVDDRATVGEEELHFTSEPLPASGGPVAPGDATPASRDYPDAASWTARDLTFQLDDPVYGTSAIGTPFDGLAASRPDGSFVAAVGGRLADFTAVDGVATRGWSAAPGGDLLQLSTAGDVTLVSTARRELVAYDRRGARMWTAEFPDVVLAPPAIVDGDLVAASVDGTLRRIRIDGGATVWSVALRTDVEASPVVVDGVAVVVDRGGQLIARALRDGAPRWSAELLSVDRLAAGDGVIAAQGTNSDVWAIDPADGTTRWTAAHDGIAQAMVVTAGLVVTQSGEGTVAWAAATGQRRWADPAGDGLLAAGDRVVLATPGELTVRAADGATVVRVPLASATVGTTRVLLAGPDGIRVLQTNTTGFEVTG